MSTWMSTMAVRIFGNIWRAMVPGLCFSPSCLKSEIHLIRCSAHFRPPTSPGFFLSFPGTASNLSSIMLKCGGLKELKKQAGHQEKSGGEKWTWSCLSTELAATNVLHGQIAEDSFPIYILITPSKLSNGSLLLFKMRKRAASQSNKGELKLITQMCSELRGRQIYSPKE